MLTDQIRLPVQRNSESSILSKIQYYVDFHIWPEREQLDPHAWLRNFTEREQPYALNILNVFLYFNERIVNAMFRSAIHSLSAELTRRLTSRAAALARWKEFLSSLIITYVQGERPSPTDSGFVFARKARQVLNIGEVHILEPQRALSYLIRNPRSCIIFVDDFVGSGKQMTVEWCRRHMLDVGYESSFYDACTQETFVVYLPLVATRVGLEHIRARCRGLQVYPVHSIDSSYSLTSPDSILWPDSLKSSAAEVLFDASDRAGIVEKHAHGWQGFHDLALAIAFAHSVPDATLPLIFWEQDGWTPLIRRT